MSSHSPKVFISYSWQPAAHQEKVVEFAKRLTKSGIHVFIDVWDLKPGQDQYAFMERMATNPEIDKILIISNKAYTEKANLRQGGVGTEVQIISNDIYSKVEQTKVIPLVFEKDDNKVPYLPLFLKGRIFIDFSEDNRIEQSYEELIRNIFDKPALSRPIIGVPPEYVSIVNIGENIQSVSNSINKAQTEDKKSRNVSPTLMIGDSVTLFAQRIGKAFPGVRGLEWFTEPDKAVDRLMLLLRQPLKFKANENDFEGYISPIWWFRAGSSMMIENVKKLSNNKILMDGEELLIKRVAVHESSRYYHCFVYVETQAEEQTGLYNYSPEEIENHRLELGYFDEEYALFNGRAIKRTEYDDGAAIIDGNVVDIEDAELRTKYLTDYNFIICAQDAPFNSNKFDSGSENFLDGILSGTETTSSFFEWMKTFRKHEK